MNTSTTILLPLVTSMLLLSSNGSSATAADLTVTSPSTVKTTALSKFASSANVMFTPVPYRRTVATSRPVMVANLRVEQAGDSVEHRHSVVTRPTETVEFVKQAVLKRIADYKAGQVKDLLVPEPRELEPGIRPTTNSSQASVAIESKPYLSSNSVRNRRPINFHSTVGIRTFH